MLGLDPKVIERANNLQPAKDAKNAVITPAGGLRVEMRPHIDRQGIRVRAFPERKHVAHGIEPHGAARSLAP